MKVTLLPPHDVLHWGKFLALEIEERIEDGTDVVVHKITTETLRHEVRERTSTVVTAWFEYRNPNGSRCETWVDVTWENGECYRGAAPDSWRVK